jgi:Ser/Thr protein kinase RdoA (MazF antagonist)
MTISSYLAVIRERYDLPDPSTVELRRGQFHDVVLTPTTAYRFPRDEGSRARLPGRAALLAVLAEHDLGFAVPGPLAPVCADEPVGRCHLVTTRVPGRPLTRGVVGAELGRVLAALAAATDRLRGTVGPPVDRWIGFADGVERELFPLMSAHGQRRARRELDAVLALRVPSSPVLVHGDLGGDNLLWQPGTPPRLAGVIDWDDVFLGSAANDVASIAATYGWSVAAQAAGSAAVVEEARVIKATFALQQALPAALSGDIANLDDGLRRYR